METVIRRRFLIKLLLVQILTKFLAIFYVGCQILLEFGVHGFLSMTNHVNMLQLMKTINIIENFCFHGNHYAATFFNI